MPGLNETVVFPFPISPKASLRLDVERDQGWGDSLSLLFRIPPLLASPKRGEARRCELRKGAA
jgi:hypothetical protein